MSEDLHLFLPADRSEPVTICSQESAVLWSGYTGDLERLLVCERLVTQRATGRSNHHQSVPGRVSLRIRGQA